MSGLSLLLQIILAFVLVFLALLSLQLLGLTLLRWLCPARRAGTVTLPDSELPQVVVQLPVCDEGALAVRVARAAAQLNWPRDRLEIQLLDDGQADRHGELQRAVRNAMPPETNLVIMRRGERSGFKAGNLAFGLRHSRRTRSSRRSDCRFLHRA